MGGNAVRLGALFGGPVLLCALWGRPWSAGRWRCRCSSACFAALAFWQWSPAVRDVTSTSGPGGRVRLLRAAARSTSPRCRTSAASRSRSRTATGRAPRSRSSCRSRAAGCASSTPAATRSSTAGLNRLTYASWLADNAVRYVALPTAKPDKSSYARARADREGPALPEAALALRGLARLRGDASHAARDPAGGRQHRARAVRLGRAAAATSSPGEAIVRVRWTPYWFASGGLRRAGRRLDPGDRGREGLRAASPHASRRSVCSRAGAAARRG